MANGRRTLFSVSIAERYRTEGANERKSGYDGFQSEGTHKSMGHEGACAI